MQNTAKQKYPDPVAFYNNWPNEVGLFYNVPEPTHSRVKGGNIPEHETNFALQTRHKQWYSNTCWN